MQCKKGRLEVVCGSMFSGKSEELIRRVRRAKIARLNVQLFKPAIDTRQEHIHTHNGDSITAHMATSVEDVKNGLSADTQVIGIDEVQFFDMDVILLINELINQGKRIIVAGLDLDFRGIPFGCMPSLLALADDVTKLKAVCTKSGKEAHFSQRLIDGQPAKHTDPVILIGAKECYEARSRDEFEIDQQPLESYVKKQREISM